MIISNYNLDGKKVSYLLTKNNASSVPVFYSSSIIWRGKKSDLSYPEATKNRKPLNFCSVLCRKNEISTTK